MKVAILFFALSLATPLMAQIMNKVSCRGGCWVTQGTNWNNAYGCGVSSGQVCNVTAVDNNGVWQCRKITNNEPYPIFVTATDGVNLNVRSLAWQVFYSPWGYSKNVLIGAAGVCDMSTINCSAVNGISWQDQTTGETCHGNAPAGNWNTTTNVGNTDAYKSGNANFFCDNATWNVQTPRTCVRYEWEALGWGTCGQPQNTYCGNEGQLTQTRTVRCKGTDGNIYPDGNCNAATRPSNTQACRNTSTCSWYQAMASSCSASCGPGTETWTVYCRNEYGANTGDDSLCPAPKPAVTRACTGTNCSCSWDGNSIPNGTSVVAYSITAGDTCPSETRTCTNGALTGSYPYADCQSCPSGTSTTYTGAQANPSICKCDANYVWNGYGCEPYVNCTFAGTSMTGAGGMAEPYGCKCNSSGQTWCVTTQTCEFPPAGCDWYGTMYPHGGTVTAYQSSSGSSCPSEVRTCNNGSWSGSWTNTSCTVTGPSWSTTWYGDWDGTGYNPVYERPAGVTCTISCDGVASVTDPYNSNPQQFRLFHAPISCDYSSCLVQCYGGSPSQISGGYTYTTKCGTIDTR